MPGSTMPLPTVAATATPKIANATKLKNAAQSTAHCGRSTRVETMVAMELAASWKPFMKSNASASSTRNTTMCILINRLYYLYDGEERAEALGIIEHNAFDNIGNVLAAIG